MRKRGYVKSPHGKVYKDYDGDLMVILSFLGERDILNSLILVYCQLEDEHYAEKFGAHVKKGSVVTKYNLSTNSLLTHLKHLKNKELKKVVKKDLEPLWKMEN